MRYDISKCVGCSLSSFGGKFVALNTYVRRGERVEKIFKIPLNKL